MKKKGFILLETILGIFIIGLISIISLNLLSFTPLYFQRSEENMNIDYIAETVFENLKSKDIENLDFLESLTLNSESNYPLSEELKEKYLCKVVLTEENDYLWCFKVIVSIKRDKVRTSYEEFQGSIPK